MTRVDLHGGGAEPTGPGRDLLARRRDIIWRQQFLLETLYAARDAREPEVDVQGLELCFALQLAEGAEVLRDIDQTLLRREDGSRASCEQCLQEIGTGRLRANPVDRLCDSCRERWAEPALD